MTEPMKPAVVVKPVLGITPRNIWEGQRIKHIENAMIRYILAGNINLISQEWVDELKELYLRAEERHLLEREDEE